MNNFFFFPLFVSIFYLALISCLFYFIYTWVNKFISLKQEHNDLLREVLKKMENRN